MKPIFLKVIVILSFFLLSSKGKSQVYLKPNKTWMAFERVKIDSTFILPFRDTSDRGVTRAGAMVLNSIDKSVYVYNGNKFSKLGFDYNVVKYSDTGAMLAPYLLKVDTMNKWIHLSDTLYASGRIPTKPVISGNVVTDSVVLFDRVSGQFKMVTSSSVAASGTASFIGVGVTGISASTIGNILMVGGSNKLAQLDTTTLLSYRVKYGDTSAMLSTYLRKVDTANNWRINGNSISSQNFIGTTNNQDLIFKRGGIQSGILNFSSGNTSFGVSALSPATSGGSNTAIGNSAMLNNTSGASNTALGSSALRNNTTGGSNVAVGLFSLQLNTTGINNVAVGVSALKNNSTASYNTAIGTQSLQNNTIGTRNVANGNLAMILNDIGSNNSALGYNTLAGGNNFNNVAVGSYALATSASIGCTAVGYLSSNSNTTGKANTSLGDSSLLLNTSGNNNIAVGYASLLNNSSGNNNIAIGVFSAQGVSTGNKNIAIGDSAMSNASSNSSSNIVIGNKSAVSIGGNSNIVIGNVEQINSIANNELHIGNTIFGTSINNIGSSGKVGIGVSNPTAYLELPTSSGLSGSAPLKIDAGTLLTTPEVGAIEYNGTDAYITNSTSTRYYLQKTLKGSATLDFPNTGNNNSSNLTIVVTGASVGDPVVLGTFNFQLLPAGSNATYTAWVSAANVVNIRFSTGNTGGNNPPAGVFNVSVLK